MIRVSHFSCTVYPVFIQSIQVFIFLISAISGNLVSATLDPYSVSVGASGGIFGIMGGCVAYVVGNNLNNKITKFE